MYNQFDDEVFLAPETSVSLHFEAASDDDAQEWDIAAGEALERAERTAWARHGRRDRPFRWRRCCDRRRG